MSGDLLEIELASLKAASVLPKRDAVACSNASVQGGSSALCCPSLYKMSSLNRLKGLLCPKRNLSLMNFSAFGPNEHHPEAALRAVSQAEMDVWSACAI